VKPARLPVANGRVPAANRRMSVDNRRMAVDITPMSVVPHPLSAVDRRPAVISYPRNEAGSRLEEPVSWRAQPDLVIV
jgi:hypothetical protein